MPWSASRLARGHLDQHAPCAQGRGAAHLHHLHLMQQPRDLLKLIPGISLRNINEPELCCGAAGSGEKPFDIEAPEYQPMTSYSSDFDEDPAAWLSNIHGTYSTDEPAVEA